jgi:hypothetical protein
MRFYLTAQPDGRQYTSNDLVNAANAALQYRSSPVGIYALLSWTGLSNYTIKSDMG